MSAPTRHEHLEEDRAAAAKARLRGFQLHLGGFAVVMAALVPTVLVLDPDASWIVLLPVGWGSFLAIHAAYAMGLFDVLRGDRR